MCRHRSNALSISKARIRARGQLGLPFPTTWGGKRRGAGRKPNGVRAGVSHLRRPEHVGRHPLLVTLRVDRSVGRLRRKAPVRAIQRALGAGGDREAFRVTQFSVQQDHLHLIVEAEDKRRLSRGMQGLSIRLARAINRAVGRLSPRRGRVFADRYHARPLRTPLEVRNALLYCLNNVKKHLRQRGVVVTRGWVDGYSSAPLFDGWRRRARVGDSGYDATAPPVVALPRTWLLRIGWRRRGLLEPDAIPGKVTKTRSA